MAIKLAPYRRMFCASPAHLAQYRMLEVPEDLAKHNCLIGRGATLNSSWPVLRGKVIEQMRVSGNFTANNGEVLRDAAMAD